MIINKCTYILHQHKNVVCSRRCQTDETARQIALTWIKYCSLMCARSKETLWPTTSLSRQSCLELLLPVSRGMRSDRESWLDQVYLCSNSRLLHHEYLAEKYILLEISYSFMNSSIIINTPRDIGSAFIPFWIWNVGISTCITGTKAGLKHHLTRNIGSKWKAFRKAS